MLSQTWKLREQGVSLCLCDDQPNTREYRSCACPMRPPALWDWQATEQPVSWLHDFPVSGKTRGQGPASSLSLSYFLYNSVFKQLALTAPADLSPRRPCSGLFWWTAGLASPTVCRKTDVSHPSCLLSPPSTSQRHGVQACCLLCLLVCFLLHFPKHGFLSGWKHRRLLPISTCRALVLGDFQEVDGGG